MAGKIILEFYAFDIDYSPKEKAIRLFGFTKSKERVVVLDRTEKPYFYVVINPNKRALAEEFIKNLKVETEAFEAKVKGIDFFEKKLSGNPVSVLRVETETPEEIGVLKNAVREAPGYLDIAEADISFYRKYLIDKKMEMLSRLKCQGTVLDTDGYNADFVIEADSIEESSTEDDFEPKILAFDIETYSPIGTPRPGKDPIIMISIATNGDFEKVITWKRSESCGKFAECVDSESRMLQRFFDVLEKEKPNLVVGYNTDNFDFPYIVERARKHKIEPIVGIDCSKIDLARRGIGERAKIKGIPHIDLYPFIRHILGPTLKTETYNLNSVAEEIAGETKLEGIHWTDIAKYWDAGGEKLAKLIDYSMHDSKITLALAKKIMLLMTETCRTVGQPLFDVTRMTYGQCVEWFLAKNAARFKELIPQKHLGSYVAGRANQTYEGGYVHEPTPGVFDNIVVYDFRSLYPSIIVSHNICPTTIFCDCCKEGHKTPPINGKSYHFCSQKKGFIPEVLEDLITRRQRIKEILKNLEKSDPDYSILSARSYALKTIANAMYGYLGFARSRWYCMECAASITAWARQYIKDVIESAQKEGFKVLYADSITKDRFVTILDKNGMVSIKNIEELFNDNAKFSKKYGTKEIINLSGYKALTVSKTTKKPMWAKLNAIIRHKTDKPIYRVSQKYGETVVTKDHSLITDKNGVLVPTKPKELKNNKIAIVNGAPVVREIKSIDLYEILKNYTYNTTYKGRKKENKIQCKGDNIWFGWVNKQKPILLKRKIKVDSKEFESLCRLLGAYIAEGSSSTPETTSTRLGASISSSDIGWLEQLKTDYQNLFLNAKASIIQSMKKDRNLSYNTYAGKRDIVYKDKTYKLQMMNGTAAVFFKMLCGQKSSGKKLPEFIFHVPEQYKQLLLNEYLKGDGSRNTNDKRYSKAYVSKNFRLETLSLHLISGLSFLLKQLGYNYSIRYNPGRKTYTLATSNQNNSRLSTKVSIEKYNGFVYDLSVEGTQMFADSCGQILLHNTDSCFINLDEKTLEDADKFVAGINEKLPGMMELEFQGFYTKGIFVAAKKRYALADAVGRITVKGFELVRRDWSKIAKETQTAVLNAILIDGSKEKAVEIIKEKIKTVKDGKLSLEDVSIYTQLTRDIDKYESVGPHVAAAKKARMQGQEFQAGQILKYVIVKGEGSISDKAYLLEQAKENNMEYDPEYYINNQVLPAVERIFEVLGYTKDELRGKLQTKLGGFFK